MTTTNQATSSTDWPAIAARVAAAFGVAEWDSCPDGSIRNCWGRSPEGITLEWFITEAEGFVFGFGIYGTILVQTRTLNGAWDVTFGDKKCHAVQPIVKGLYLLGYPETHPAYTLLEQRGYGLTAHEKIEAMMGYQERLRGKGIEI